METPEVGKAYHCPDGVIRWVTHQSVRGNYHLLWLDESSGIWHWGGVMRPADWPGGVLYPSPQAGDTYTVMGLLGTAREVTA